MQSQAPRKKLGEQGGDYIVSALTNLDCFDDDSAMDIRTDHGNEVYDCFHVHDAFTPGDHYTEPDIYYHRIDNSQPNETISVREGMEYNIPRFFTMTERIEDIHYIGGLASQVKPRAWQHELKYVYDYSQHEYLMSGIMQGFRIVDEGLIPSYECVNYNSCEVSPAKEYMFKLFK